MISKTAARVLFQPRLSKLNVGATHKRRSWIKHQALDTPPFGYKQHHLSALERPWQHKAHLPYKRVRRAVRCREVETTSSLKVWGSLGGACSETTSLTLGVCAQFVGANAVVRIACACTCCILIPPLGRLSSHFFAWEWLHVNGQMSFRENSMQILV